MESIKQVITALSPYRGSEHTAAKVKMEIERRWGKKAASLYDPAHNCRSYQSWLRIGYKVKPKEKAIKSISIIEVKDEKGKVIKTIPRTISLFFITQVNRMDL